MPNLKSGQPITAVLAVPNKIPLKVVTDGTYYEKEADTEASATLSRAKPDQPVRVQVKLPPGAVAGFASLAKGTARVSVSLATPARAEPIVIEGDCPIPPKNPKACEASLTLPAEEGAILAKVKNADIKGQVSIKGADVPKVKSGDVSVTP